MNLFLFFLRRTSVVLLVLTLVIPPAIPFLVYYLLMFVSNVFYNSGVNEVEMQELPSPGDFSLGERFLYTAHTGSAAAHSLSEFILNENHISGAFTAGFTSLAYSDEYVGIKTYLYQTSLKTAALNHYASANIYFHYHFIQTYYDDLKARFNVPYSFPEYDGELEDLPDIFILLHVEESEEKIGNTPIEVAVRVTFNDSISAALMHNRPDAIYDQLSYEPYYLPFWTGYAYSLKKSIDEWAMTYYTGGTRLTVDFGRAEPVDKGTPIDDIRVGDFMILFGIIPYVLYLIFLTIMASRNCDYTMVSLYQLGISHWRAFLYICATTTVVALATEVVYIFVFYGLGMYPYCYFDPGSNLLFAILAAISLGVDATLLTLFFGEKRSKVIMASTVLALSMFVLPALLIVFVFQSGIFDPSLIGQNGMETLFTTLPSLLIFGLLDRMISLTRDKIAGMRMSDYSWRTQATLLTTSNFMHYSDDLRECTIFTSKAGISLINEYSDMCVYKEVPGSRLVLEVCIHVVLYLIVILYCAYIFNRKGFRKLRLYYVFQKDFWALSRLRPATKRVEIYNLRVSYKVKGKCRKRKLVLEHFNFALPGGEISALVGESGRGKSTFLSFLSGQLPPDKDEDYKLIALGNFDLSNPLHALQIKRYVGYCTYDFTNVFLDMSVFDNALISMALRYNGTKLKMKTDEMKTFIVDLLTRIGLGDTLVLKRKASQLSGGMLRRLACCNSILGVRDLILFDEISAGVDPLLKRKIWEAVGQTTATVLLTTHDMAEVENAASRINVLQDMHLTVKNEAIDDFLARDDRTVIDVVVSGFEYEKMLTEYVQYRIDVESAETIGHRLQFVTRMLESTVSYKLGSDLEELKARGFLVFSQIRRFKIYHIYNSMIKAGGSEISDVPYVQLSQRRTSIYATYAKQQFMRIRFSYLYIIVIIGLALSLLMEVLITMLLGLSSYNASTASMQTEAYYKLFMLYRTQEYNYAHYCYAYYLRNDEFTLEKQTNGFVISESEEPLCMQYLFMLGLNNVNSQFTQLGHTVYHNRFRSFYGYFVDYNSQRQVSLPRAYSTQENYFFDTRHVQRHSSLLSYLSAPSISLDNYNCDFIKYCERLCNQSSSFSYCITFSKEDCVYRCVYETQTTACSSNAVSMRFSGAGAFTRKEFLQQYRLLRKGYNYSTSYYRDNSVFALAQDVLQHMLPNSLVELRKDRLKFYIFMPSRGGSMKYTNNFRIVLPDLYEIKGCDYLPYSTEWYVYRTIYPDDVYSLLESGYSDAMVLEDPVIWFSRDFDIVHGLTEAYIRQQTALAHPAANAEDIYRIKYSMTSQSFPRYRNAVPAAGQLNAVYNTIVNTVRNILFIIIGLLPFLVIANWSAIEYQSGIFDLMKIHSVSLARMIASRILFCFTMVLMYVAALLLLYLIFCTQILAYIDDLAMFEFIFAMNCIFTLPSGMLLGIIAKQPKYTNLVSILVIVVCIVFILLEIANDAFAALISVLFPFYGMVFTMQLVTNNKSVMPLCLSIAVVCFVAHFGLYILVCCLYKRATRPKKSFKVYSEKYLAIQNVSFWYNKKTQALDDVSFAFDRGRIFGLLGTNGSGKSTLMNIMVYNLTLEHGTIAVGGQDLFASKHYLIILVPQKEILVDNLTVLDHIALFSSLNDSSNYIYIVNKLKIQDLAYQPASTLSGGYKRRLSIALALTSAAPIVAFDEPSTGLGAMTKLVVYEAVQEVNRMGRTVILTTHDLDEVEALVDDVVVLKGGHVVFSGNVYQIRRQGLNIDCSDAKTAELAARLLDSPFEVESTAHWHSVFTELESEAEVKKVLLEAQIDFAGIRVRKATLEEDFLYLLK